MYRAAGSSSLLRNGGFRQDGCMLCPRGRYGTTTGLTSSLCTGPCPIGKYRDTPGATSITDCRWCPEGKFGSSSGLTSRRCSGDCTSLNTASKGYYSDKTGLVSSSACKTCPVGYRGWQCDWDLIPRLGFFSSDTDRTDGKINENAHQYIKYGDGKWSATRFAKNGNFKGDWPTAGAIPEGAVDYPGRIPWNTNGVDQGFDFDPAKDHRANIRVVP
jgi:hypothetical protein